jgi:hypothetical protein
LVFGGNRKIGRHAPLPQAARRMAQTQPKQLPQGNWWADGGDDICPPKTSVQALVDTKSADDPNKVMRIEEQWAIRAGD